MRGKSVVVVLAVFCLTGFGLLCAGPQQPQMGSASSSAPAGCLLTASSSFEIVTLDEPGKTVILAPGLIRVMAPGRPEAEGVLVVPAGDKIVFQGMIQLTASTTEVDSLKKDLEQKWGGEVKVVFQSLESATIRGMVRGVKVFENSVAELKKNGLPIQGTVLKKDKDDVPELEISILGKPAGSPVEKRFQTTIPLKNP